MEMSAWVAKLCYACKLERRDVNGIPMNFSQLHSSSAKEKRRLPREKKMIHNRDVLSISDLNDSFASSNGSLNETLLNAESANSSKDLPMDYTLLKYCSASTSVNIRVGSSGTISKSDSYIHLKDCEPCCPIGTNKIVGHEAMIESNQNNSRQIMETHGEFSLHCKCALPPPRPPKSLRAFKLSNDETFSNHTVANFDVEGASANSKNSAAQNDICDLDEVPVYFGTIWNDEELRPAIEDNGMIGETESRLSSIAICVNPPKIDRSSKPRRKKFQDSHIKSIDETRRTNFSVQCGKKSVLENQYHNSNKDYKQLLFEMNCAQGKETAESIQPMLEYYDPIRGTTIPQYPIEIPSSSSANHKDDPFNSAKNYVLIDEEKTKAVFEANLRQMEFRKVVDSSP